MTIEQANIIADRINALPKLYDSPPDFFSDIGDIGWSYGQYYPWSLIKYTFFHSTPCNNLYYPKYGFDNVYRQSIGNWKETPIGQPRYITIDDLRMMAYVGIEYARAKLEGWRYRYGDCGEGDDGGDVFPSGCLVRTPNGERWIHTAALVPSPPYEGQTPSQKLESLMSWHRMMRRPKFEVPTSGYYDLPNDFTVPTGEYSGTVQIGTIEGNDDLVQFYPERPTQWFAIAGDVWEPSVQSGGLEIFLTTENNISDDNIGSFPVVYQQNSTPVYYAWNNKKAYDDEEQPRILDDDPVDVYDWYYTLAIVDSQGMYVPLKSGVTYNVFARFTNAVLRKYEDRHLISFVRRSTGTIAPTKKWDGVYPTVNS